MKRQRHVVPAVSQMQQAPVRQFGVREAVWVPALQAVVTGLFTALVVTLLAAASPRIRADNWTVFARTFAGAGAFTWLVLMALNRSLLYRIEELTRWDVNRDGEIGQPQVQAPTAPPLTAEVWVHEPNRSPQLRRIHGIDPLDMSALADGVIRQGRGLARRQWEDTFTQPQHQRIVEALIKAGLAYKAGSHANAPVELNAAGRMAMREWARPTGGDYYSNSTEE